MDTIKELKCIFPRYWYIGILIQQLIAEVLFYYIAIKLELLLDQIKNIRSKLAIIKSEKDFNENFAAIFIIKCLDPVFLLSSYHDQPPQQLSWRNN